MSFSNSVHAIKLTDRTKLSLSHALAQSVKISLFEELISSTIEQTKDIPRSLSETGKIGLPRSEIMKQIGNLFILRININLVGSILDSPVRYTSRHLEPPSTFGSKWTPSDADLQEFFWSFPDLEPLYNAARSYLEISQRVDLLNARVDVSLLIIIKSFDQRKLGYVTNFADPARHAQTPQGECQFFPRRTTRRDRHCLDCIGDLPWHSHYSCRSQSFLVPL